VNGLTQLRSG